MLLLMRQAGPPLLPCMSPLQQPEQQQPQGGRASPGCGAPEAGGAGKGVGGRLAPPVIAGCCCCCCCCCHRRPCCWHYRACPGQTGLLVSALTVPCPAAAAAAAAETGLPVSQAGQRQLPLLAAHPQVTRMGAQVAPPLLPPLPLGPASPGATIRCAGGRPGAPGTTAAGSSTP